MYAIFLYVEGISFESLPSSYLESPYISIDQAFSLFESEFWTDVGDSAGGILLTKDIPPSNSSIIHSEDASDGGMVMSTVPLTESSNSVENSYLIPDEKSFIQNVHEILKDMYDASYILSVNDNNQMHCVELIEKLRSARALMNNFIKFDNNIALLPSSKQKEKDKGNIVQTSSSSFSQLPLCKRRQKSTSEVAENCKEIKKRKKANMVENSVENEIVDCAENSPYYTSISITNIRYLYWISILSLHLPIN